MCRESLAQIADPLNILNPDEGVHYKDWWQNLGDPGGIFAPGGLLGEESKEEDKRKGKEKKQTIPKLEMPDLSSLKEPPRAGMAEKASLRDFRKKFGRRQTILTPSGETGPVRRRQLYNPQETPAGTLLGG